MKIYKVNHCQYCPNARKAMVDNECKAYYCNKKLLIACVWDKNYWTAIPLWCPLEDYALEGADL